MISTLKAMGLPDVWFCVDGLLVKKNQSSDDMQSKKDRHR